jgi:hypothetical protein
LALLTSVVTSAKVHILKSAKLSEIIKKVEQGDVTFHSITTEEISQLEGTTIGTSFNSIKNP